MRETRKVFGMAIDQSEQQKGGCSGSTKRTVHFATLMDICHLKNAEMEPKYQKCKGQVVQRGDTVKDDSGSYAVLLTEQVSCASQMTAAKVMDVITKQPDRASSRRSIRLH